MLRNVVFDIFAGGGGGKGGSWKRGRDKEAKNVFGKCPALGLFGGWAVVSRSWVGSRAFASYFYLSLLSRARPTFSHFPSSLL